MTALPTAAWVLIASALTSVLPEVFVGSHPLVRGAVTGRTAYAYGYAGWEPAWAVPLQPARQLMTTVLLRQGLDDRDQQEFYFGGWPHRRWPSRRTSAPARWQVAAGQVHFAEFKPPATHQRVFPPGPNGEPAPPQDPGAFFNAYPLTEAALAACRGDYTRMDDRRHQRLLDASTPFRIKQTFSIQPFADLYDPSPNATERELPPAHRWRAHFDFLPDGGGEADLFLAWPGRLTHHRLYDLRKATPIPSAEKVGSYIPGWEGPFYVCTDGEDRHFVTAGGRVFTLPAGTASGAALALTRQGDPVLALVHDADAGKSYAFTKSHYFHVTAKPDPKPHGLTAFPGATSEEALDTVAKCGRVIRGIK